MFTYMHMRTYKTNMYMKILGTSNRFQWLPVEAVIMDDINFLFWGEWWICIPKFVYNLHTVSPHSTWSIGSGT